MFGGLVGFKIVKTIYHSVDGHDKARNTSFITIHKNKEANKIHIYSPKESSDVVLITKEARKLMEEIKKHILE